MEHIPAAKRSRQDNEEFGRSISKRIPRCCSADFFSSFENGQDFVVGLWVNT
jgi:hypothetical protein